MTHSPTTPPGVGIAEAVRLVIDEYAGTVPPVGAMADALADLGIEPTAADEAACWRLHATLAGELEVAA